MLVNTIVCMLYLMFAGYFFFFSSRRRHTRCSRDWSSDVCSSDLANDLRAAVTAAVVDEDHLDRQPEPLEHTPKLLPQQREVLLLIVDGDDDGEVRHRARPGPDGSCPATRRRASVAGRAGRARARWYGSRRRQYLLVERKRPASAAGSPRPSPRARPCTCGGRGAP